MSNPQRHKPRQLSAKGPSLVGSKWVGTNWHALAQAKEVNGGEIPETIALKTTEYPNKDLWNEDNLPVILFYLNPPPSLYQGPVKEKTREDGTKLRDFEILPDRIGVDVKGWLIEAWRRTDPRISYDDILSRMTADPGFCGGKGLTIPTKNSLQMDTHRSCRKLLGSWQVDGRQDEVHRTMVEGIEKLTYDNLIYNTILPRCNLATDRLVRIKFERKSTDGKFKTTPVNVTPENLGSTTFPLTHFCQHLPGGIGSFDQSMDKAWELLLILQERARIHEVSHWSKLDKNCRPVTWLARTKGAIPENRPDEDRDGDDRLQLRVDTYDGGCAICTWHEDRDGATDYTIQHISSYDPPERISPSFQTQPTALLSKKRRRLPATAHDHGRQKRIKAEYDVFRGGSSSAPVGATMPFEFGEQENQGFEYYRNGSYHDVPFLLSQSQTEGGVYDHNPTPFRKNTAHQTASDFASSPYASDTPPVRHSSTLKAQPTEFSYPYLEAPFSPPIKTDASEIDLHHLPYSSSSIGPGRMAGNELGFSHTRQMGNPFTSFGLAPDPYHHTPDVASVGREMMSTPIVNTHQHTWRLQQALQGTTGPLGTLEQPRSLGVGNQSSWNQPARSSFFSPQGNLHAELQQCSSSGRDLISRGALDTHHTALGMPSTPPLDFEDPTQRSLSVGDYTQRLQMTPPEVVFDDIFLTRMLHSDEFDSVSDDILFQSSQALFSSPTTTKFPPTGHTRTEPARTFEEEFGNFVNTEDETNETSW